jgi:hypothetical protein
MRSKNLAKKYRIGISLVFIAIFSCILLFSHLPQLGYYSAADSNLVQTNIANTSACNPCTQSVTFAASVASGDVIVVAIADSDTSPPTLSVSDNFGSTYSLAVSESTYGNLSIFDATTSTGCASSCNVTVEDSTTASGDYTLSVAIFDVSGVTTTLEQTSAGGGMGTNGLSASTSSSVSFLPGAFLLGAIVWNENGCGMNPGTDFTLAPDTNGPKWGYDDGGEWGAEYEQAATGSPTDFPATITSGFCGGTITWAEAGIALQPPFTTTSTTTSTTTTTSPTTTTTTTISVSISTTTTTVHPSKIPTSTKLSCNPNPDPAKSEATCTAKVTATGGYLPLGKVKFYSSEGGTFSKVTCADSMNTLICTVSYTPPASLAGMTTRITANYFSPKGSDFRYSTAKMPLQITAPKNPITSYIAPPTNAVNQIAPTPIVTIGIYSAIALSGVLALLSIAGIYRSRKDSSRVSLEIAMPPLPSHG